MNNYDVAGILRTYSDKARHARNTKHLHSIIRQLKQELDLRKIQMAPSIETKTEKKGS